MVIGGGFRQRAGFWKLVSIACINSVRTSMRTPHFTIIMINWLTLFKVITTVYSENHTKHINAKCSDTSCWRRCYILLPLSFKRKIYFLLFRQGSQIQVAMIRLLSSSECRLKIRLLSLPWRSVCQSASNNSRAAKGIFTKFHIRWEGLPKLVDTFQSWLKWDNNNGDFTWSIRVSGSGTYWVENLRPENFQ
jgi:hypothetical protein